MHLRMSLHVCLLPQNIRILFMYMLYFMLSFLRLLTLLLLHGETIFIMAFLLKQQSVQLSKGRDVSSLTFVSLKYIRALVDCIS